MTLIFSILLLLLSTCVIFSGLHRVFALEFYSKSEKPFGLPLDSWVAKYWNWDVSLTTNQFSPQQGSCLINNSSSMAMLVDTTVDGSPNLSCNISSKQGVIIPLWIGWCDNSGADDPKHKYFSYAQLTQCARDVYNLGNIKSVVNVDGNQVAKLDVALNLNSGQVNYKVNALNNVTEFYSKGFNLTIPADTHEAGSKAGTWHAGSQGWWVFLKPISPGEHTVFYNVRVTPTGPLTSPGSNPHFADITYHLRVR